MRYFGILALLLLFPVISYASLVNINTANAALLDTLPGIGPSKAAAIVDYRAKHGPFAVIEELQKVSGIGPVTFANLKGSITVGAPQPQPSAGGTSYETMKASRLDEAPARQVEPPGVSKAAPITSPETNIQTHEEEVRAPASATDLAAAGAALPPQTSRGAGLFRSPWTLGLLGIIVLASGAFIFL